MEANDEIIPTRQSLLSRIKNWEDQESWRDFFNTYWKLIYGVAMKAGLSDVEAQEVVQETVLSVARKIGEFKVDPARGSFKHWLLTMVRWRITDAFRRRQRDQRRREIPFEDTATTPWIERLPDQAAARIESVWDEEWERNLVDVAMERVRTRVNPKQYQIFDLYVIKQWSVQEVAQALKVNISQVYLAKHRVSKLVQKEIVDLRTHLP